VSNKADADSYKSLSKSIDFRKNASAIQDFKNFGMQSVNFENLRFQQTQQTGPNKPLNTSHSSPQYQSQSQYQEGIRLFL